MSVDVNASEFMWAQKYRPRKVADTILPAEIKQTFTEFAQQPRLPSMILTGTQGIGKTTIAKALCDEIGADYIMVNGSEDSGIDVLRTRIRQFASTVSLVAGQKVVIIDEADYLNPNSTQPALRGFIEEFSKSCSFILTCNFKARIIEQIHSRCPVYEFKIQPEEKPILAGQFFKRVCTILTQEGITFNKQVVADLVARHFPDFRRVLNELQRYAVSGTIDAGILVNLTDDGFAELVKNIKGKKYTDVRKWVVDNSDMDTTKLYRLFYDKATEFMEPKTIPELVLILAEYGYRESFCADREINTMAMFTEIMMRCAFK